MNRLTRPKLYIYIYIYRQLHTLEQKEIAAPSQQHKSVDISVPKTPNSQIPNPMSTQRHKIMSNPLASPPIIASRTPKCPYHPTQKAQKKTNPLNLPTKHLLNSPQRRPNPRPGLHKPYQRAVKLPPLLLLLDLDARLLSPDYAP